MSEIKTNRRLISTAVTFCNNEQDAAILSKWSKVIPRMIVLGTHNPRGIPGARYFPSAQDVSLALATGQYLMEVPGVEVCVFSKPDVDLGGDMGGLIDFIASQRLDLAWAARANEGEVIVMSSSIPAHFLNDIPSTKIPLGDMWLHNWMTTHMQPHRYIDADRFGIVVRPNEPVVNAYEVQEPKSNAKRARKA